MKEFVLVTSVLVSLALAAPASQETSNGIIFSL